MFDGRVSSSSVTPASAEVDSSVEGSSVEGSSVEGSSVVGASLLVEPFSGEVLQVSSPTPGLIELEKQCSGDPQLRPQLQSSV